MRRDVKDRKGAKRKQHGYKFWKHGSKAQSDREYACLRKRRAMEKRMLEDYLKNEKDDVFQTLKYEQVIDPADSPADVW